MRTFKIQVTDKTSGNATEVGGDFSDDEVGLLEGYLAKVQRLQEATIIKDGVSAKLNINYQKGNGFKFDVSLPTEDSIPAFLHRLRPFILHQEPSSYNRITAIIGKQVKDQSIRNVLKRWRKVYDGRDLQSQVQIMSNGKVINSEQILFDWLNSFEYHNDSTKRAEIERLHELMPLEASRAIFLMMLMDKVKAITAVADFIELLLGRIPTMDSKA